MVWQQGAHEGVARLVIGNQPLRMAVGHGTTLEASDDAVRGITDLLGADGTLAASRCEDGRLVHEVAEICAAEAGCAPGDLCQSDPLIKLFVPYMDGQNLLAPLHVGQPHGHAAVESARPQESTVQDIGPVCGRDNDDPCVAFEAVHLCQDLVQGLLALVVASAHSSTALPPDGVDLVDEDDARRLLLGLLENVADTGGSHAHEELDEL
mmetsp:Transcript_106484/g.217206  ORF Transcript_106484/g.217206 Transcript_106484/m.217206 type:complete len:209 (-) Transcript_106484:532-1158(-)